MRASAAAVPCAVLCAGMAAWWSLPGRPRLEDSARRRRVAGSPKARSAYWLVLLSAPLLWVSIPGALAAAAMLAFLIALRVRRTRRSDRERTRAQVVEALDQLCAEVAAGLPPGLALSHAAETWPELASAARAHDLGGDLVTALREVAARPGAEGVLLVAAAWSLGSKVGGSLVPALQSVAGRLRVVGRRRRVIDGELASARATGRLVSVLPVAALLVGTALGADPVGFLLRGQIGWLLMAAGLSLVMAGVWWIEALADRASR